MARSARNLSETAKICHTPLEERDEAVSLVERKHCWHNVLPPFGRITLA